MATVTDRRRFFDLLTQAWDVENKAAAAYSGPAAATRPIIQSQLRPIPRTDLEKLAKGKGRYDSIFENRFLYLPLPESGTKLLPVVGFVCGGGEPPGALRLACALFLVGDVSPTWPKLQAIGFRFESPEQGPRHGYYHAQPFKRMMSVSKGKRNWKQHLPNAPVWMATDTPAFPLLAADAPSLFSNLLLSLYGPEHVRRDYGSAAFSSVLTSMLPKPKTKKGT